MSFIGLFFLSVVVIGSSELFLLIAAADHVGLLATFGLCVLTGIVGGALVRHQGLRTIQEIQGAVARGEVPAREIVSGLVLLALGVMLILPGFITDTVAFLLLIPPLRLAAAALLVKHYKSRISFAGVVQPDGERDVEHRGIRIIDVQPEEVPGAQDQPPDRTGS